MKKLTVMCLVAMALAGAAVSGGVDAAQGEIEAGAGAAADAAVDRQTQVEDSLVSIFENLTLKIRYEYIQNLNDGRGFTAGRAGFTSGTDDLLQVVQEYTARKPGNALAPYLPALRAVNGTDSTAGLGGFPEAWRAAATDPQMIAAQDAVNDQLYRVPSRKLANKLGLVLPLSRAALYEAGIQHGYGDDPDSVKQIAARATAQVGSTPAAGADEKTWLLTFLEMRRDDLLAPANTSSAEEWRKSVGRADAMITLFQTGNFDLTQPITVSVFGKSFQF
ncbi:MULTISPECIES: chitosanase [Pandoraea]|uniref:chitosanase n=1 Tax=Pandoraea TaxID=93217 RepID=UPI001F5C2320|nr:MULTISPECIES: chitosanase [Pandoraea]MCI3205965.1 chitosanase [Pandoraea sp. LA3]MDN4583993.1 chitosanase [Pandoraea capi]